MIEILDCPVDVVFPAGHHRHCLIAQIPNHLVRSEVGYVVGDPERQWQRVRSVLEVVAGGDSGFRKVHLLVFPEGCLPLRHLDDMLALLGERFRPSTVTMFGLEHVALRTYRDLLVRFRDDNPGALERVLKDLEAGGEERAPVNLCCIAVKERGGKLRVFLEAKGHPFHGEEFFDKSRDLYQGQHVYFFRCHQTFNFMTLICLDYLYRDLYASNIRRIIDHANQLYFASRQTLDALFVIQCNPKPEHRTYREILSGFYGEYLEDTPGVRETVTVFGNCSAESTVAGASGDERFGVSSAIIGGRHRLAPVQLSEFSFDDFGGAPLYRLRFGTATRLYYFNLPLHHEHDPRSTRVPLKVHSILRPGPEGGWLKMTGDEILHGLDGHGGEAA
jgi:predicted amidohydrolase